MRFYVPENDHVECGMWNVDNQDCHVAIASIECPKTMSVFYVKTFF